MPLKPHSPAPACADPPTPPLATPPKPRITRPLTPVFTFDRCLGLPIVNAAPVLHASSAVTCEECPRKWLLDNVFALRKWARSQARDTGSYAHLALGSLLRGGTPENATLAVVTAVGRVLDDLAHAPAFATTGVPDDLRDDISRAANIGLACGQRVYSLLREKIEGGLLRVVAVELSVDAQWFDGSPIRCTLDTVFQARDDSLWLFDLKTTGEKVADACRLYDAKLAPWVYTRALRWALAANPQLLGIAAPVAGFIHGVIQTPTIHRKAIGKPNEESLAAYLTRCNDWWAGTGDYEKDAAKRVAEPLARLHSQAIPLAPSTEVSRRISDILSAQAEAAANLDLDQWPRHERACHPGVNQWCQFADICLDEVPGRWAATAARAYTQTPDPLDADPCRHTPGAKGGA